MTREQLKNLSDEELEKLYSKYIFKYGFESKPLYKRRLGGILITIIQEQKRRLKKE